MSESPKGWIETTLGDLSVWGSGGTPSRSSPEYFGGSIPWVTISDLNDGVVSSTLSSITKSGLENSAAKLAPVGSIMVALYGSIGKLGIAGVPLTTNQAIAYSFPNESAFDSKYLFHYLHAERGNLLALGSGVTQKNIYLGDLKAYRFPLSPRVEQTRIVEKLEELLSDLDAGAAELKAAQAKLVRYRQSLLKAAVEGALTAEWRQHNTPEETGAQLLQRILTERRARWEAKQLAKFAEQDKAPPKDWQQKYPEPVQPDTRDLPELPEGWVWASVDQLSPDDIANGRSVPTSTLGAKVLRLTAIKSGRIDQAECKVGTWSEAEAQPFSIVEGDLLIARGNGSLNLVGRAGIVGNVRHQIAYPDTMIRLRVVESVVSASWINLVWESKFVRTHLEQRARTSAGIYKISQPDIVSAPIPVGPLEEQAEIISMIDGIFDHADIMQRYLYATSRQSTAQRKNILRAAFSGQLVPQNPNDEPASALLARIRAGRATEASTTLRRRKRTDAGE